MNERDKKGIGKKFKIILMIYTLYSYIYGNFVIFKVNQETLAGSVTFGLNNSVLGLISSAVISFLLIYFCFKGNKLAITLIFVGSILNIIFSLMMIETSNFSLYNVILIVEMIISAIVVYLVRPLA